MPEPADSRVAFERHLDLLTAILFADRIRAATTAAPGGTAVQDALHSAFCNARELTSKALRDELAAREG